MYGKGVFTSVPNSSASDWYADHCKTMVAYIEKLCTKKLFMCVKGGLHDWQSIGRDIPVCVKVLSILH